MIEGVFNYVGVVVNDLKVVEVKVLEVGFKLYFYYDYESGEWFYFNGLDGVEYEVVSYV